MNRQSLLTPTDSDRQEVTTMSNLTFHPESTPNGQGYRFYGPDSVYRASRQLDHAGYPTSRWDLFRLEANGAGDADWVLVSQHASRRAAAAHAVLLDHVAIRARVHAVAVQRTTAPGSHPNHRGGSCDRCAGVAPDQWPPLDRDVPARVPTPSRATANRWARGMGVWDRTAEAEGDRLHEVAMERSLDGWTREPNYSPLDQ